MSTWTALLCLHELHCYVYMSCIVVSTWAELLCLHELNCCVYMSCIVVSTWAALLCLHELHCYVYMNCIVIFYVFAQNCNKLTAVCIRHFKCPYNFTVCKSSYSLQVIIQFASHHTVCKSVHHHTVQINQPTTCNNFSSLLFEVHLQLNMFRGSSRPSSGAQQLQ